MEKLARADGVRKRAETPTPRARVIHHTRVLPRFQTALVLLAVTASCALGAATARADEAPAPGRFGLQLGAAASRFEQGTGSPPPCCYEREDWHTWGPEVQARALYRVKPWLWPSLELGFGFLSGTAGEPAERLRITQRTLRASPAAVFHFGDRVFLEPRVALHFVRIDARFEEILTFKRNSESADHYVGAGVGLSVGFQLKPKWALGLDAHRSFLIGPGDVNNFDGYGLFARFTP